MGGGHPSGDVGYARNEVRPWDGHESPVHRGALRYPRSVWKHTASALVVTVVLTPIVVTWLLAQDLRTTGGLATTTQFVVFPTVLVAAILLYVQHRVTGSNVVAWATLCLTIHAVQGVMLAGLRAGDPGPFFARPGWILIVDLPVAVLMLIALRCASRVRLPVDPLGAGFVVGLLVAGINLTLNSFAPALSMTSPPVLLVEVLFAAVGIAIGLAAYRLDGIPAWFRLRLGLGALALVVNRIAMCQDGSRLADSMAVVGGVAAAALMVNGAASGLRFALGDQRRWLTTLADRVAAMEAGERDQRARLHEITNSISSIAIASSLMHQRDDVPESQRHKLGEMLESESARLARILTNAGDVLDAGANGGTREPSHDAPEWVDLDEVIRPLITSHRTLRRPVDWQPSGCVAVGDSDAVAEVLNILLDNAARHAPDSHTSVEVTRRGETVEVAVRDDGPGIPAEVRHTMFDWGARGPDSRGQGIGLHLAHQLMTSGGNSLHLDASHAGTSFVIALRAAEAVRS
jgi:signal transduction histidine kinase